jgi:integrase/recombinase XerC
MATGIEAAVGDYLVSVRARGGSPRTEDFYSNTLRQVLLPWCQRVEVSELGQLDQPLLDRLNSDLLGQVSGHTRKALSRATVATYLRGVRQFVKWAQKSGRATQGLTVQPVKVAKKMLVTLDRAEIGELEAAAATERDKLLVRILGDTGLRLAELLSLTPGSLIIDGRDHYLKVLGKGSRERRVPVKPQLFQRIKRYAEHGRPADCHTDRIFISLRRRPNGSGIPGSGNFEALDGRAVQMMLGALGRKVGTAKPVNPHAFRHSWVTNSLRKGMNPLLVAQVAGHTDLTMITTVYAHLTDTDAHRAMMLALAGDD